MTKPDHTIVLNKNARRNFSLNETFQAGIALEGWEVKSLRMGKVDAKDTYVTLKDDEAWLIGLKIDAPGSIQDQVDITRSRKLLLHKKEIFSIGDAVSKKGETCVLTKLYWKNNKVKCDIAIGKGKKSLIKEKTLKKEIGKGKKAEFLKILTNHKIHI
ncbi:MAG: hypothetical protein CM15mP17_05850 [Gammaproteobacteria bacterium]|nr:MAG: hypothetical protein CM15mP17_05850 [Gammaproteobacteria bacterium]